MRRWIETRLARLTEWIWKLIPKTRWCIHKRAICDFQDGCSAWKSDNRWGAGTARGLKRDKFVKIAKLSGCKNFVGEREREVYIRCVRWPLASGEIWEWEWCGFRSLNNSTSERVLKLLEPVKLTVWKVMIEIITVVKFRMDDGGGHGAGCFEVKIWADTVNWAKFANMTVARFRKCSDLVSSKSSRKLSRKRNERKNQLDCAQRA